MTTRQSELFAGQDWTVLYRLFSSVNFNASDPATINRSLRDYIRTAYPEEFSDWTESSEFVAIIDLLAWLAGTLAYKTDLAARENFLDTAEARESILRLARFLSYNPSRNRPARGILKLVEIETNEDVFDSFGRNLASVPVQWDDPDDEDWFEKFTAVLNAALVPTNPYGTPLKAGALSGVNASLYRLNSLVSRIGTGFSSIVAGRSIAFTLVNGDFEDGGLIERTPNPNAAMHLLHLQDGAGNSSPRTGLFAFFKQGTQQQETFLIDTPVENQTFDLAAANVTQDDVWVQTVNDDGSVLADWTKVPAVFTDNITFNSLPLDERNIFSVVTRDEDRVTIRFSDGRFGNAPVGLIRITYRTANGESFTIRPQEIENVRIVCPYTTRNGSERNLTLTFTLFDTLANSTPRETEEEIRRRAPLVYATQNRMVSGEDYNTFPLQTNLALKIKAINRVYSGHSRFNDLHDPTGTYSDVTTYGEDAMLFREERNVYAEVPNTLNRTPRQIIDIHVLPMLRSREVMRFMQETMLAEPIAFETAEQLRWQRPSGEAGVQSATGRFLPPAGITDNVWSTSALRSRMDALVREGAALLFEEPAPQNVSQSFRPARKWAAVVERRGPIDFSILAGFPGNLTISEPIPTGWTLVRIQPRYAPDLPAAVLDGVGKLDDLISKRLSFALWYDYSRPTDGNGFDQHWEVRALVNGGPERDGTKVRVMTGQYFSGGPGLWQFRATGIRYVVESEKTVEWYHSGRPAYDAKTGQRKVDTVRIVRVNQDPHDPNGRGFRQDWDLTLGDLYAYPTGQFEPRRIAFDMADKDEDGVPDHPDTFVRLLAPPERAQDRWLFWQRAADLSEAPAYDVAGCDRLVDALAAPTGTKMFALDTLTFHERAPGEASGWKPLANMIARIGRGRNAANAWYRDHLTETGAEFANRRQHLGFVWKHYAPSDHRIDPSVTNIHDIFVLTTAYDTEVRRWAAAGADPLSAPQPPTELDLRLAFADLEDFRMFSDQIIWRPVRYRLLFGPGALAEDRAQIKVVKLPNSPLSDGEIRSRVVRTVNDYFLAARWEFGETFYFTELAAYLHQQLAGVIGSAVLVPLNSENVFGDGFEIRGRPDEMFLSTLQVNDVALIASNSPTVIRSRTR